MLLSACYTPGYPIYLVWVGVYNMEFWCTLDISAADYDGGDFHRDAPTTQKPALLRYAKGCRLPLPHTITTTPAY
ncbi:hypothetical protein AB1N83_002508 [Pleurotus pulmonarius]